MAYKTKSEKRAWRKGLLAGLRRKKKQGASSRKKSYKKPYKKKTPRSGAYTPMGRIDENRVDDRHGPVVFWDDFEYDSKGRIKGEWIDGKFIPD